MKRASGVTSDSIKKKSHRLNHPVGRQPFLPQYAHAKPTDITVRRSGRERSGLICLLSVFLG